MENCYNLRALLVDLHAESTEELELDPGALEQCLGGAAYNLALYRQYESYEPLIIGVGPLTASFAPASCLGVATAKSPLTGKPAHVPLTWQSAVELKLAGFDFVVITGKAASPKHLWLHDEIAEIENGQKFAVDDLWASVDALQQAHGDINLKVISAGPAGMKGSLAARLSENYWPARDTFALGAVMGLKNLVAIAIRGLGYFETEQEIIEECLQLRQPLLTGALAGKTGPGSILENLGAHATVTGILKKYTHRNLACFHCPYPCQPFLMHQGDPGSMKLSPHDEPGVLLTVLPDLLALSGEGEQAPAKIAASTRAGINPMLTDSACEPPLWPGVDSALAEELRERAIFSTAVPPISHPDLGLNSADEILMRQAMAYVIGICPVYMMACPEMNAGLLAKYLSAWSGEEIREERLLSAARKLIE